MNERLPEFVYGSSPLAETYQAIDQLKLYDGQIDYVYESSEETDDYIHYDLENDYINQMAIRDVHITAVEDKLIQASNESLISPDNKSLSVLLAYASYIGCMSSELEIVADDIALKASSIRQGVPLITNAYRLPFSGIAQDIPNFQLTRKDKDDDFYDGLAAITFNGQIWIARKESLQYYRFNASDINNMLVGSEAINGYINYLSSSTTLSAKTKLSRIKTSLEHFYRPDSNQPNDELVGVIEF